MRAHAPAPVLVVLALALLVSVALATSPTGSDDALWKEANIYFDPLPSEVPDPDNVLNPAKVELGRRLYFDTALSREGTISCNSCHSLATFGVDGLPTSPGDRGQVGSRNSPTVLNSALHGSQFWDGRAEDVEEQAGMPVLNPVEMAIPSEEYLVDRLAAVPVYQELFPLAFPDDETPLRYDNVKRALAAFERTLLTPSPFDAYLAGDREAISEEARAGLGIFMEYGCAQCHNGVNVGAASFRRFGLNDDYWVHTQSKAVDEGRMGVTGDEEDRYVFRVASLRNVAETAPYFHDGSVPDLKDAVAIMVTLQVGVDLAPEQIEAMAAFLESLTGELPEEVRAALTEVGASSAS